MRIENGHNSVGLDHLPSLHHYCAVTAQAGAATFDAEQGGMFLCGIVVHLIRDKISLRGRDRLNTAVQYHRTGGAVRSAYTAQRQYSYSKPQAPSTKWPHRFSVSHFAHLNFTLPANLVASLRRCVAAFHSLVCPWQSWAKGSIFMGDHLHRLKHSRLN